MERVCPFSAIGCCKHMYSSLTASTNKRDDYNGVSVGPHPAGIVLLGGDERRYTLAALSWRCLHLYV